MKFWTIVPGEYMTDALQTSDTTLVLYHLIKKGNSYFKNCKKFKKAGGKIVMDNSFYEYMKNPPIKELVSKAKMIDADVLCLPDLPYSPELEEEIKENINKVRQLGYKGKLMMCVWAQGKDWNEDLRMFRLLTTFKELDIIAIPYCFGSRKRDEFKREILLNIIEDSVCLSNIKQKIHLFGCASWKSIKRENRHWISSIDGTMPWRVGYFNETLPISQENEPHRPKNYFEIEKLSRNQRACINYNLQKIKREVEKNES